MKEKYNHLKENLKYITKRGLMLPVMLLVITLSMMPGLANNVFNIPYFTVISLSITTPVVFVVFVNFFGDTVKKEKKLEDEQYDNKKNSVSKQVRELKKLDKELLKTVSNNKVVFDIIKNTPSEMLTNILAEYEKGNLVDSLDDNITPYSDDTLNTLNEPKPIKKL